MAEREAPEGAAPRVDEAADLAGADGANEAEHPGWVGHNSSVWDDPRLYEPVAAPTDPPTGPFDAFNT
ncbi:MAG: hypothetical protein ACRDUB_07480, partial [Mycobacterium sp.]